jgi:hypothetical protein
MVGDAGLGEALEHTRVGVPGPWAGGKSLGDVELRKYGHGNTLCLTVSGLAGRAKRGKPGHIQQTARFRNLFWAI